MLGKFNEYSTVFNLLTMLLVATYLAACTTTGTSNEDTADDDVVVSEPNVDVGSTKTAALADEPKLEDLPVQPSQHEVEFKASAPEQYTVVPGDTLWDLSNRFLVQPWFWPEIWYLNPQINNPHLIYPGDVITIFYVAGKPYLTVGDGPRISGERLSPKVRSEDIDQSAYGVPINAIQPFIIRPRVVSEELLNTSPYIVGSQEPRLAYGAGDRVYVRGLDADAHGSYTVYRAGDALYDPRTNELLGYEAIMVGDGDIVRIDDPATFDLIETNREALRGDRLLPINFSEQDTEFVPHAPSNEVKGNIISLFDAITQVGSFQVVTVNLGERDGMEKGHVLSVNQAGRVIADPFEKRGARVTVELPEETAGLAMVFRTFDKVSYALIMETTRPIRVGDSVTTP